MARRKLRVGVLFGGRSGEHEVSLRSARSILGAIDRRRYAVVPIAIARTGEWFGGVAAEALLAGSHPDSARGANLPERFSLDRLADRSDAARPDVLFPVLHGTFGEDGTIQGLLELLDLPYVGSGVLGSAAGMDKEIMKRLFGAAGLPQTPHATVLRSEWRTDPLGCRRRLEKALRYPFFTKPANLGSSVGISKVHDRGELAAALDLAASFDRKLIVEEGVGGPGVKPRELEVAVLGNERPEASVVGEIVPAKEFYDYEAKYETSGPDESVARIPAKLPAAQARRIQAMAIEAFRACDCAGLARVDFLLDPGPLGTVLLNEINTMPGFTSISMYPKLWEASGLLYPALIDRLIALALERHEERRSTHYAVGG